MLNLKTIKNPSQSSIIFTSEILFSDTRYILEAFQGYILAHLNL